MVVTGTRTVDSGKLETLFLDDETGTNERTGNNCQNEPNQIAGVHLR